MTIAAEEIACYAARPTLHSLPTIHELTVAFRDDTCLVNDQWTSIQADAYAALAKIGPGCIGPAAAPESRRPLSV